MAYRKIILVNYLILISLLLLMKIEEFIPDPFIALFGIATVVSFIASPICLGMAIYSFKLGGSVKINILFLFLATLYFVIVAICTYKLWPQLMGV